MQRSWVVVAVAIVSGCIGGGDSAQGPPPFVDPAEIVVRSDASFWDSQGLFHVIAEVENVGSATLDSLLADVAILDASGKILDMKTEMSPRRFVPPGERAPIAVAFSDPQKVAASYRIKASGPTGEPPEDTPLPRIFNVQTGPIRAGAEPIWIEGEIQNLRDQETRALIVITLYGASGGVVGVAVAKPDPDPIPAGDSGHFRIEAHNLTGRVANINATASSP